MFYSARIKLTAQYLVIIMAISVLFSVFIYSGVNAEYSRIEDFQERVRERLEQGFPVRLRSPQDAEALRFDPELIHTARIRLLSTLGLINLIILCVSGAAGYYLAGRTLRPIQSMVDEQNRFIADASHELRTPLTSLRLETEVGLRNKSLKLTEAKKLLESNLEEVINLQSLSENLLQLAHHGQPKTKEYFANVSLRSSLEEALRRLDGIIQKKSVAVVNEVGEGKIYGQEDRITELFVILVDNAVKYSPEKSTVIITAKKRKEEVVIAIEDEGVGIHEKDLPYIFDRFYRASKSRTKNMAHGYGLGLSIAKKIVEQHGGEIEVDSIVGKGTRFEIRLPRK
jgi:two-component system, OmpR family, sensor histidine kinase CiaH